MTHNDKRYQFLRDRFALESSNDEADFAALAHLNGDEFDAALDAAMLKAGFEIAQEVEPGVNQLIAQLHDDQKWTVSEQQQFAQFLKRFPNESSQGIMSLGDAWKHGKACAAPQAVNAELLEALQVITLACCIDNQNGDIGPHVDGSVLDMANAAIQKAEGAKP